MTYVFRDFLFAIAFMLLGGLCVSGYLTARMAWEPTEKTLPINFVTGGEKPKTVLQLNPNGVLNIDVPALYKQWEIQSKEKKEESKK